ncbi:hypothetical protein LEP1GSC074_3975 [Leptospira noguchii str. Hook]|uniref:Uncharacterized protein n=1 Tax=Leptospira noguchii serovar Autumnalis str. ZUN142 TaxID=1085540 RepID=M6U3H1_9LEPT|nr:hypothetical protein LEP1GSC186_3635 [Leptospira noguchii serovar Autumnalis str. ZUN142]EMS89698.1 hypothetical protein LEP1GSC074_3975 [Leptospira noguchii str. Hook]
MERFSNWSFDFLERDLLLGCISRILGLDCFNNLNVLVLL